MATDRQKFIREELEKEIKLLTAKGEWFNHMSTHSLTAQVCTHQSNEERPGARGRVPEKDGQFVLLCSR
jgi:hypothetical protein